LALAFFLGLNRAAFAAPPARCIALTVGKLTDRLDRPIVLVGLMGAGKSTVGRRLAKRLGLPFIDTDAAIQDAAGYTPSEVFERFGEDDFRDGERRLVARLVDGQVRVIATGGEVFIDPRTRELLNSQAVTVWLDAPVDLLTDRTGRLETRPLLRNVDRKTTLERLAAERRALYAEAHLHVKSGNGAHSDVVDSIIAALDAHLDGAGARPRPQPPEQRSSGA
jgi:shikimate kinase